MPYRPIRNSSIAHSGKNGRRLIRRIATIGLFFYLAICLAAMTEPGRLFLHSRVKPLVFGLPPYFAWNVAWVLLTFFVLLSYHLLTAGKHER